MCASESLCSPLLCFAVTASAPRSTCRAISRPAHCSCRASEPSSSRSSARSVKYLTVQFMTGDAATARAVLDAALLPPVVHAVVSAAYVATYATAFPPSPPAPPCSLQRHTAPAGSLCAHRDGARCGDRESCGPDVVALLYSGGLCGRTYRKDVCFVLWRVVALDVAMNDLILNFE